MMRALIVTDVQNDFCPGGALAVQGGDGVVPVINRLQAGFKLVVATQDWHPPDHGSFAASHPGKQVGDSIDLDGVRQVLWPVHCVQGTHGARLHPELDCGRVAKIFRKGTDSRLDSYSGFFDNGHRRGTGLAEYLRGLDVTDVYLCGLTTEYCVKFTAMDAVSLGFRAVLIADACRGVNLRPGDAQQAIEQMADRGVAVVNAVDIVGTAQSP